MCLKTTEEIRHAHKSKNNLNCENQIIFLMIAHVEKWYYLTAKILHALI